MFAFSESLTAFFLAILFSIMGEIADKTQLVILGFALKFRSPFKVFFGGLLGHAFMDGIAIILGTVVGVSLQAAWLNYVVGALFIALGVIGIVKMYRKKKKKGEKKAILFVSPFWTTFVMVFFTEIGDRTQMASGLLAAEYKLPIPIFLGVVIGLAITIGLNVFVGSKLAERLPVSVIKIATSVIFIIFGLITVL